MRNAWMAGACALFFAAMAACGGDAAAAGPVVRDSAGIRIVQNERPAWTEGEAWRVSDEPLVDVGVAEGDANQQFGSVSDALRLSDGTLVVADAHANELRAFDGSGRYLRTLGRKGGGPGEFTGLWSLFLLPGDTVAAYDAMASRLTLFAPGGAFVRTVALGALRGELPPKPVGVFGDGSLLVTAAYNPVFRQQTTPTRDTLPLARYSAAGTPAAELARVPGEETVTITGGSGSDRFATRGPVPFGRNTFTVVSGTRLLIADNDRYELAEHGPDGRLVRIIRRVVAPEPVTDADRAGWADRMRSASGASSAMRQMRERLLAATPFPEHKSAFSKVLADAAGNAWVQRHAAPDAAAPWDVFDPAGRFLGTVKAPAGLRVTQIGADFLVGVWKDELEVEHVRMYPLVKPAR